MSALNPAPQNLPLKLSVCLPTFNRAALLREALEALGSQGDASLFRSVEVLVSDNASADSTSEIVCRIREQYPFVRLHYVRHPENIGMDRNLYGVVQRAAGEFVLVLSDDDILLPGALAKLLELIETQTDLDAICLNMRTFQKNPDEETPAILSLKEDVRLLDQDTCLALFGTWITFLSVVAFRRSALRPEGYDQRIGTYFVLSYLFLDALHRGALVLREPCVAVRDNYVGGYNFFEVFVTEFQKMLNHAEVIGYSPQVTRQVFRQHLRNFLFPFLVAQKCRKSPASSALNSRDGVQRLLRTHAGQPFLLFAVIPLLLLPSQVLGLVYGLRQRLKGSRAARRS